MEKERKAWMQNDQPPPLPSTYDGRAVTRHGYQMKIMHHVSREPTARVVLDVSWFHVILLHRLSYAKLFMASFCCQILP